MVQWDTRAYSKLSPVFPFYLLCIIQLSPSICDFGLLRAALEEWRVLFTAKFLPREHPETAHKLLRIVQDRQIRGTTGPNYSEHSLCNLTTPPTQTSSYEPSPNTNIRFLPIHNPSSPTVLPTIYFPLPLPPLNENSGWLSTRRKKSDIRWPSTLSHKKALSRRVPAYTMPSNEEIPNC